MIRQKGSTFTLTISQLDGGGVETQKDDYVFIVPAKKSPVYSDKTFSEFLWLEGKDNDSKSLIKKGQFGLVWDIRGKDDNLAVLNELWSLSPDKKELTIGLAIGGGMFKRWYVFDRQE